MLRQRAASALRPGLALHSSILPRLQTPLAASNLSRSIATKTPNLLVKRPQQFKLSALQFRQGSRIYSTAPPAPQQNGKIVRGIYRIFAFAGFTVITLGGFIVAFFLYDASTYRDEIDAHDVPIPAIALNPRRGGPKNLPIAEYQLDDTDSDDMLAQKDKPRLVVIGCGWGSVALLKNLNPDNYHVTVVSTNNYFLYTPLLPSATVGTLELRSLIEPVRRIIQRVKGHFLQAKAESVDFSEKLVEVSQTLPNGETRNFYLPYDKLVIAVGSQTNTHGVDGLDNCHFLKSIGDARIIRRKIVDNFERACLPSTTDDERRKLLSFVVCGGGPTGVEFAAELYDMLNEDLSQHYPKILRNEVSVHLIQSRGHILNTYDETLSKYAEERFNRDNIDVLTNARVVKVEPERIIFTQKDDGSNKILTKELPFGFCLWSTGVAQTEFSRKVASMIDVQTNKHALETDTHLRLIGAPLGDVYCIGDCSTVQNNVAANIYAFLRQTVRDKGQDPEKVHLDFNAWRQVAAQIRKKYPQAQEHLKRLDKLFQQYDKDQSGTLDFNELKELLSAIDKKLTSLPATAQRANQQGTYLARKFNTLVHAAPGLLANEVLDGDVDSVVYKAFDYRHLGSLAYIGNAAVFDYNGLSLGGGLVAVYLWRSVYFAQSVSLRTRMLLAMDWSKRALFGRDMMSF